MAEPELAVHFHVCRESTVLLQWHDALLLPVWLSDWFTEEQIASMAGKMRTSYRRAAQQTHPADGARHSRPEAHGRR